jgi:predicted permease
VGEAGLADLNRLLFYVLLPAQLIATLGMGDWGRLPAMGAVLVALGVYSASLVAMWLATSRYEPARRGSVLSGAVRANGAFIGLPVVALLAETMPADAGVALHTTYVLLLACMIPTFNAGAVLGFRLPHHGVNAGGLLAVAVELPRNPIIVGAGLGAALGALAPGWMASPHQGVHTVAAAIGMLAAGAIPLALIVTGAQVDLSLVRRSSARLLSICAVRLVVVPAVAWGVCWLVGLAPIPTTCVVLLLACPTAVASVPMARQLGGDVPEMAAMVAATTLLCPVTLLGWLVAVRAGYG